MPTILLTAHLEDAIFMAGGIQKLREANPEGSISAWVAQRLAEPLRSVYRVATTECPAFCYVQNPFVGYLFVDGCNRLDSAVGVFNGYRGIEIPLILGPTSNAYFYRASRQIWEAITGVLNWAPVVNAGGWSLGGCAAYLLPFQQRSTELPILTYRLNTYGMPRPVTSHDAARYDIRMDHVRWMNNDDPVPLLPPRVTDFPAILPAFGVQAAIRASEFVQPRGGVSINAGGVWRGAELPTAADGNFVPALANWLLAWDNGDRIPHAISEYIGRLNAALLAATPHQHIDTARREPEDRPGARDINANERRFVEQVNALSKQQNTLPFSIPPRMRFKAQRVGRVWYVIFNETIVATPGLKRAAKRVARQGNAWLDSLQTLAVVDPDAFGLAFRDYLLNAANPTGGFSPVLQVTQPT